MIEQLETNYGTMFVPDTDNGQYWWLKTTGASPEDEMIQLVCDLLDEQPKGVAFDCGANFGCWALPLSRHANLVYAFEPQRVVFDLLQRSVMASLIPNVICRQIALGERPGKIKVPVLDLDNTTNFGGVSLGIPHSEHPDAPMYDVNVLTIDDIADAVFAQREDALAFLKVDCEGAEQGIFKGAERTIRRFHPIIIAEADHALTDTQALGSYIESLGYNVELVQDNNFIGMPV